MIAFVTGGAGFLLAVLWFDLMFDVQVLRNPARRGALDSVSAYYRRVTTSARPMNPFAPVTKTFRGGAGTVTGRTLSRKRELDHEHR